jgi:hypothetical protein
LNNQQVLKQLYLSVGKIARTDFPDKWKDLITDLISMIKGSTKKFEALKMTKSIIKELSKKKLLKDKEIFTQVSEYLLSFMCQLWLGFMDEGLKNQNSIYNFKNCKLCTKIIGELILGLKELNEDSLTFLKFSLEKMRLLLQKSTCLTFNFFRK